MSPSVASALFFVLAAAGVPLVGATVYAVVIAFRLQWWAAPAV